MSQYRNVSDDTVQDFYTGKVIEPGELVEISDALAEFYVGHPVLQELGAVVAAPASAPAAPVQEPATIVPQVTPAPDAAPAAASTEQEQS